MIVKSVRCQRLSPNFVDKAASLSQLVSVFYPLHTRSPTPLASRESEARRLTVLVLFVRRRAITPAYPRNSSTEAAAVDRPLPSHTYPRRRLVQAPHSPRWLTST